MLVKLFIARKIGSHRPFFSDFLSLFSSNIPSFSSSQLGVEPLTINLHLIGGRFLPRIGRTKLAVEIELLDLPTQKPVRWRSKQRCDNGLCPVWDEPTVLDVRNPLVALIRFAVLDEDVFGDANLVGQATFPVEGLRRGLRSVPLENGYGHRLELASLLVHVETFNPMVSSSRFAEEIAPYSQLKSVSFTDITEVVFRIPKASFLIVSVSDRGT